MKKVVLSLVLVGLFSFALPSSAFAATNAWTTVGPSSGSTLCVAVSPAYASDHTLFAGGNFFGPAGIFKSTSGGAGWNAVVSGVDVDAQVHALAISPHYASDHTVFAATAMGVLRSTSGGASWSSVDTGFPDYPDFPYGGGLNSFDIGSVAISPAYATDHTAFIAGSFFGGPGIFKSNSGGEAWTDVSAGLPLEARVRSIAISPAYATDHTLFVGTDTGVFVSTSGGANWGALNAGFTDVPIFSVAVSPAYATGHMLFAAGDAVHSISLNLPNTNGTPTTPASIATLRHGKSFTVYGYIVRHTSGTYPVTLQFYRYQSGHWVLRKSTTAKVSNTLYFSKYSDSTSVPYSGRWRVRARHKVGSKYLYSGYRTFTAS